MLNFLLWVADDDHVGHIQFIYDNFYDELLKYAKGKLYSSRMRNYEYDAEDAVQNALYKIAKYAKSINFDMPKNELKLYVKAIVSNEVINIIRDTTYTESFDDIPEIASDEDFVRELDIKLNYDRVVKEIEKMDDRYSGTLLCRYSLGMSVNDIAKMLGVADQTVYSRLTRGKKLLLDKFAKEKIDV